ncbi:MerR family transcriptional regulator [Tissierella praeacuta]|uniref:MerR family transcriptional regulator n=1 Tax=Tissierella praeacuta TaxID=43131 RepID=UPI0033400BEA
MRIGKFAENSNLTIDTVRHYMDLGLIIPEMHGGQYDFDNRCEIDLQDILDLKNMGFTLNEIKSIFMFRRLGNLTPYEQNQYYKTFFESKYEIIGKEIENLKEMRNNLRKKIDKLQSYNKEIKNKIGINLKNLSIFKCPRCNRDLMISKGDIDNNQIINGELICNCGVEYKIDDGILISNSKHIEHRLIFDNNYIGEYISSTDIQYLDNVYKGLELIHKKIDYNNFKNKTILELGSGMGFFLRHIYDELPEGSTYIAVDNDLGRHKFLKGILDFINCNKNIIFICSDFTEVPIENKSIDVLVDFSGSSNYGFENEQFLLNKIDNYIKESAWLIGTYIMFKNFNANSRIDSKYRKNFNINYVKKEIEKLNYKIIYDNISQPINKGGKYEDYFVKGEEVYSYLYYGKR